MQGKEEEGGENYREVYGDLILGRCDCIELMIKRRNLTTKNIQLSPEIDR